MKSKLKAFFTNNLVFKLAAFLIALTVWTILSNMQDPIMTRDIDVPVEYLYADQLLADEKLMVLSAPSTIPLTVSYRTSRATQVTDKFFSCKADLVAHRGGSLNSQKVDVTVTQTGGTNVILDWKYAKNDATVTVNMDEYITKTFTVQLQELDSLADNSLLHEDIAFSPATVTISGPMSAFGNLASVRAAVKMSELSQNGGGVFNDPVELKLYDSNNNIITNNSGLLKMSDKYVMMNATVNQTKPVSVTIGGVSGSPAEGYRYAGCLVQPDTVNIHALPEILEGIGSIVIPKSAINIDGINVNKSFAIDLKDYLPEGVFLNEESSMITVSAYLEAAQTKLFSISTDEVELKGRKSGFTYSVPSSKISVRVRGYQVDLDVLNISELEPYVDCSNLEPGVNRVRVVLKDLQQFSYDNGDSITMMVNVEVIPTETETETEEVEDVTKPSDEDGLDESDSSEETTESTEAAGD